MRRQVTTSGGGGRTSVLKQKALRLLAYRERSRKELMDRLGAGSAAVVEELARIGLQDDARFAREWTRGKVARLNGPLRVRRELLEKGVATGIVEAVLEEAYGGGIERDLASRAARKHSPALRGRAPEGRARTMYSYLVRRGFSPALATEIAREEMHR